ncbi:hypothetical protein ECG_02341 [Echinococcus granulosus]|uniref:Ovule protein n=1 Tax=Echinococcus granulosus TaxID=6210 RepID=A0A068WX91_ECHGR|nr:hypothetical protein ECG_02341 [Echinococcus granulosus]CDS23120.1 hypothetical protein EgrG_001088100 [Echinococcus granulosus]
MKFYLLPKTCPFCQDSYYLISPSSHICQSIHSSCPSVNNVLMALPIFKVSHFSCFVGVDWFVVRRLRHLIGG